MQYLRGERVALSREIEREMKKAAKNSEFEKAAHARDQLQALQALNRQVLFSDRELQDAARDEALVELAALLGLTKPLRRIEGFDISHMQGSDTVASMVVFSSGLPDKAAYRKFKMRLPGNDDFAHMHETVSRRLKDDNRKKWGIADLMLIDGGRGQLSAALNAREASEAPATPMIGLAKREEEIIIHKKLSLSGGDIKYLTTQAISKKAYITESADFLSILLPKDSAAVKLLQRIRDESHRFALSYHSTLKRGRVKSSLLDEIPGVGAATRKKLIRTFGSSRAVASASEDELKRTLGPQKGAHIYKYLKA